MRTLLNREVPPHWQMYVRMRRRMVTSIVAYVPGAMILMLIFPGKLHSAVLLLWFVAVSLVLYSSRRKLMETLCPECGSHFFRGDGWSNDFQRVCAVCKFRRPV